MAKILIIDDDEAIRLTLGAALKREGHTLTLVSDGQEALQRFKTASPDLVITDILMPEMEGFETIHGLRHKSPSLKIICMSGGGEIQPENYLEIARKLGADRVIRKPFQLPEMLSLVAQLLAPPQPAQAPSPR